MDTMQKTIQMMETELDSILSSGNLNLNDVFVIGEVIDIIKDAETICAMRKSEGHLEYKPNVV